MAIRATCKWCGVTDTRPDEAWVHDPNLSFRSSHTLCFERVNDRTNDSRQRQAALEPSCDPEPGVDLEAEIEPAGAGELERPRGAPLWLGGCVFASLVIVAGAVVWCVWFLAWSAGSS